jgi:diguanylate cyclase (GGDEF)-like protein/PAS domain S-box-containing protein
VVSEQGLERRRDEVVISGEPCAMPDLPVRRLQVELLARLNSQGNWHDERILLRALIDEVPDLLFAKDHNSRFIVANEATAIDLGLGTPDDLIGKSDADFYPPELAQKYLAEEQRVISSGQAIIDQEECSFDRSAGEKWLSVTKVPLRNDRGDIIGLVGTCRDVTQRRRSDMLLEGQASVLEQIARNASLDDVLDSLVRLIESQADGIKGSVLLLDEAGVRLRHGAGPSLPGAYTRAIDGVAIGPKVGSCGSAAYLGETIIVADIATDPLWEGYAELAAQHGLRSCWSTPILSHAGAVLGTFAMYSTDVRTPSPADLALVKTATRIAGIAIERKQAEERIQFIAHHDALTRLPNRAMLEARLQEVASRSRRTQGCVAVLFIDLDNFKLVNDSLGHKAGDELLRVIAGRIVSCLGPADEVFRLGGDEFIALLSGTSDSSGAIAHAVSESSGRWRRPVVINGNAFQITCSIGVASCSREAVTPRSCCRTLTRPCTARRAPVATATNCTRPR